MEHQNNCRSPFDKDEVVEDEVDIEPGGYDKKLEEEAEQEEAREASKE